MLPYFGEMVLSTQKSLLQEQHRRNSPAECVQFVAANRQEVTRPAARRKQSKGSVAPPEKGAVPRSLFQTFHSGHSAVFPFGFRFQTLE